jgi:hypothetical protein
VYNRSARNSLSRHPAWRQQRLPSSHAKNGEAAETISAAKDQIARPLFVVGQLNDLFDISSRQGSVREKSDRSPFATDFSLAGNGMSAFV